MYILLFRNSILHVAFALMLFDGWIIQNWTSKIAKSYITIRGNKMMELHLNLTRLECLIPSTRLRFIIIMIVYHSAVQIISLTIICIRVVLFSLIAYDLGTAVRYLFDRHALSLSRRSEKYWKISCWIWLVWVLCEYNVLFTSRSFVYAPTTEVARVSICAQNVLSIECTAGLFAN